MPSDLEQYLALQTRLIAAQAVNDDPMEDELLEQMDTIWDKLSVGERVKLHQEAAERRAEIPEFPVLQDEDITGKQRLKKP